MIKWVIITKWCCDLYIIWCSSQEMWRSPYHDVMIMRIFLITTHCPNRSSGNKSTIFNRINATGRYIFRGGGGGGGGATVTDKKNQLSWPVAMGDNGHLQPWSRLPAFMMARVLKILETNLKSEEIINFYLVFLQISMRVSSRLPCFVLIFFISRKRFSIGEVLKCISFRIPESQKCWLWREM